MSWSECNRVQGGQTDTCGCSGRSLLFGYNECLHHDEIGDSIDVVILSPHMPLYYMNRSLNKLFKELIPP